MSVYEILTGFISILTIIVGFFSKDLHSRLKQAEKDIIKGHDEIIKNKAKMEAIEGFQVTGFLHMEKLFEEKFKGISAELTHINNGIDSKLEHINNNVKSSHELFALMINNKNDNK
jgi:hypothetical protein